MTNRTTNIFPLFQINKVYSEKIFMYIKQQYGILNTKNQIQIITMSKSQLVLTSSFFFNRKRKILLRKEWIREQ